MRKIVPMRLRLSRQKGFNLQDVSRAINGLHAVNVARPGALGNPFIVGQPSGVFQEGMGHKGHAEVLIPALTIEQCIEFYRELAHGMVSPEMHPHGHQWMSRFHKEHGGHPLEYIRVFLRGANLACWCPPDAACHTDVLLELANKEVS